MKRNYIVPALEIEKVEMVQNLMLSISSVGVGDAFSEGETGTADSKMLLNDNADIDF